MTMKYNSNLDLNIDFSKSTIAEILKEEEERSKEFDLKDKNLFLKSQLPTVLPPDFKKDLHTETQKCLQQKHQTDANNLLYTKKYGMPRNLFLPHGLDQYKFNNNDYSSNYE